MTDSKWSTWCAWTRMLHAGWIPTLPVTKLFRTTTYRGHARWANRVFFDWEWLSRE